MSEAERHEFIVTANVSDGDWDLDRLLDQYGENELEDYLGYDALDELIGYASPRKEADSEADDDDEEEVCSQLSVQYRLGDNIVTCYDQEECDWLRKTYCEYAYGKTDGWQDATGAVK